MLAKQSLRKSAMPSFEIQKRNLPIVLFLLKQSQYNSIPLWIVLNDNKAPSLIDDKKESWLSRAKNHKAKLIVTTMLEEPFATPTIQYHNTPYKGM